MAFQALRSQAARMAFAVRAAGQSSELNVAQEAGQTARRRRTQVTKPVPIAPSSRAAGAGMGSTEN